MDPCCPPLRPTISSCLQGQQKQQQQNKQQQQELQNCKGALDPFCLRLPNPANRCYFNPFVHSQCLGVDMNMEGLKQEIRNCQTDYKRSVWEILKRHTLEGEAALNNKSPDLNGYNRNCCPNQAGCKGALDPFCLKLPQYPMGPCNFDPFSHAQCLGLNLYSGVIRQQIQQCQEEYKLKVWSALRKYTVGDPCISEEEQPVKE